MEPKERILGKAQELFNQFGFKRVTMDEIAIKTGMSKKTIYQSFATKDEIVSSVVEELIERSVSECEKIAGNAENAVQEIFLSMDVAQEIMSEMNPVILEDLEKFFPSVFDKYFRHKHQFIYEKVKENLERGIEQKLYRKELNVDVVAKFRVESFSIAFNHNIFPFAKYNVMEVEMQMHELYLYGICTLQGQELIKKYKLQRTKNLI